MSEEEMACEFPLVDATSDEIREILANSKTIAIVGLSPREERPSNRVAKFLMGAGYEIIPVNPVHDKILGLKSYTSLKDIPAKIDIVDIFRRPGAVPDIVADAIDIGAKNIWMQEGIVNNAAANSARSAGMTVVMDRCMLKEHKKWKP